MYSPEGALYPTAGSSGAAAEAGQLDPKAEVSRPGARVSRSCLFLAEDEEGGIPLTVPVGVEGREAMRDPEGDMGMDLR